MRKGISVFYFIALGLAVLIFVILNAKRFLPYYYTYRYPATIQKTIESINAQVEPQQESTSSASIQILDRKGTKVQLTPVATYDISAKVVINARYPQSVKAGNELDDILTNDLALVWGKLIDDQYLKRIQFHHQFAYVTFNYSDANLNLDPSLDYIFNHVSSNHLIGANQNLNNALNQIQKGDIVRIKGFLINIKTSHNQFNTSTVRTDNWRQGEGNAGGSEFIYVIELQNGDRLYQ